jgi:SAM-dependent methyltransferase
MVLDVGCGTGQWAAEIDQQFPEATVVGLDLQQPRPGQSSTLGFVRANMLRGLPFADNSFDLVHERLLVTAVPVDSWMEFTRDLVRVTRPGGWVELVEPMMTFDNAGPAMSRISDLMLQMAARRGLDTTGTVFRILDGYLHHAGVEKAERRTFTVPMGKWGGQAGSLMLSDTRAAGQRICEMAQAHLGLPEAEGRALLEGALVECEENRVSWTFAASFGRKPQR